MKIVDCYTTGVRIFTGRGPWALFDPLRLCVSVVYGAAVSLRNRTARRPKRIGVRTANLPGGRPRVISIGNLEVGGGGKTPLTMRLAEVIAGRGGNPVVLMRGYRSVVSARRCVPFLLAADPPAAAGAGVRIFRENDLPESIRVADPDDEDARIARLAGDEAALYRRRGIRVVIDPDRIRGAEAAVRLLAPTHILLDDGFQNLRIYKDLDILLLDARRPFGNGRLFPAGTLRERRGAVKRADIVVFTRAADEEVPAEALDLVRGTPRFFADHVAVEVARRDGTRAPLSSIAGTRVALFAGIARPSSFEALIERTGAKPVISFRFVDHHTYRADDVARMLAAAPTGIPFLTTEKDWVKSHHLFPGDVAVGAVGIRMEITDWPRLVELIP